MSRIVPVFCILGGPGSGKSTECKLLERDLHLKHVAAGDLLRHEVASGSERGASIQDLMKQGKIVPSEWTVELILNALADLSADHQGVLLDGFPRNMENYETWQTSAPAYPIACLIELDCPKEIILKRIRARSHTSARVDDLDDIVEQRILSHERDTRPVIDFLSRRCRVIRIDSSASPDAVHSSIMSKIPSWK
jgi:UMP-CMP kinase